MRINVKRVHLPQYKVLCHFLEEFENGGLSLKKHQMFSVRNTPEEFKKAVISHRPFWIFV